MLLEKTKDNINFLFPNFLEDKRTYALNQNYWKKLTESIIQKNIKSNNIYTTTFANGLKMYDGNPIFSINLDQNKTVRIIQEEPESTNPEITAWIEDSAFEGQQELVIVLELSNLTKKTALDFISFWAKKGVSKNEMEKLIDERVK